MACLLVLGQMQADTDIPAVAVDTAAGRQAVVAVDTAAEQVPELEQVRPVASLAVGQSSTPLGC